MRFERLALVEELIKAFAARPVAGELFILLFVICDLCFDRLFHIVRHRGRRLQHHVEFVGMESKRLATGVFGLEECPDVRRGDVLLRGVLLGVEYHGWSRNRGSAAPWNSATDNVVTQLALVDAALAKEIGE